MRPESGSDGSPVTSSEAAALPPLVEARDLGRSFGRSSALKGLSFKLAPGGRTALLGPNGAGKSTLMKLIAGIIPPDEGELLVGGGTPVRARETPGFLGWLPERAPLNPELTVLEHMELAGKIRGLDRDAVRSETERLSEALDLGGKLGRLSGRLSLGTRRRAALALALLGTPRLLMLDEPSSSLDPEEVRRLNSLVKALSPETALLVSSHILEEAFELTGGAMILKDGRLAAFGSWESLAVSFDTGRKPGDPGFAEEVFFKALGGATS
jgi:ABC-2 type transport system ATP-binding protein